jgi:signal transduction histidine kinase
MKPKRDDHSTLLSDVFHELHQPLTGLHFSFELAAQQGGMANEQVMQSLQLAQDLRRRIVALQELLTERVPRRSQSNADLGVALMRVLEDLAPIAAAERIALRHSNLKRMPVRADAEELRAALFRLVEALISLARKAGSVAFAARRSKSKWRMRIRTSPKDVDHDRNGRDEMRKNLDARVSLAIARKMMVALGADVDLRHVAGGYLALISFPAGKAGRHASLR